MYPDKSLARTKTKLEDVWTGVAQRMDYMDRANGVSWTPITTSRDNSEILLNLYRSMKILPIIIIAFAFPLLTWQNSLWLMH